MILYSPRITYSYQDTCPQNITGCSDLNQCTQCDSLCGKYCQNIDENICGKSNCMKCSTQICSDRPSPLGSIGYFCYDLIPINNDGSGYCQYWKDSESIEIQYESKVILYHIHLNNYYRHNEIYQSMIAYPFNLFIMDKYSSSVQEI